MKLTARIRKWNQATHRDLGYFFAGMTIIYSLSGIALNHIDDWDPNYAITRYDIQVEGPISRESFTLDDALALLRDLGEEDNYKKHYFPDDATMKIFLKGGSVVVDMETGAGILEYARRRSVFFETNYLHYNNPKKLWTWFSDIFAGALIILAVSGLFILKGKKGITGRGAWLTGIGILIPAIFLLIYL
ncbi:MAG: hypothetical protein C0600_09955 [Ignavibacteria bacterium]|nr:MAG: hypothetical protein C0600_09955 [Ignavibacteria bacterium]